MGKKIVGLAILALLLEWITPLPIWPGPHLVRHILPALLSLALIIFACLEAKGSKIVSAVALIYGFTILAGCGLILYVLFTATSYEVRALLQTPLVYLGLFGVILCGLIVISLALHNIRVFKMKKRIIAGVLILAIVGAAIALNLFYREEKTPILTETQIKNKIVFVSGGNILMANEDGTDSMIIAKGESPAFSPDGKKLAFLAPQFLTFEKEIYLVDFKKGSKAKIYGGLVSEFKFSPDSQKIAVVSSNALGNKKYSYDLIVIDLESNKVLKLLEGWENIYRISWSPDGERIAFGEIKGTYNDTKYILISEKIFIINADGTNLTELTEGREPVWSPKENKIAFVKWYGVENEIVTELSLVDLVTENITKIAENANSPSWSPDGKKIAFIHSEYKRNEYGNIIDEIGDIFIADIETGDLTKLTGGDPNIRISGPLAWSPDGKNIAFAIEPKFGGDIEIYLVNLEDKSMKNISNNPKAHDTDPCFPPP